MQRSSLFSVQYGVRFPYSSADPGRTRLLTICVRRRLRHCLGILAPYLDYPVSRLPNLPSIPHETLPAGHVHDLHGDDGRDDPHDVLIWQPMGSVGPCLQDHHANAPRSFHVVPAMGNLEFLQDVSEAKISLEQKRRQD